jgi:hypothetical protein
MYIYIMPRKSNKRSNKRKSSRKQKPIVMVGCSKKNKSCKNKKVFSTLSSLSNKGCPNCGPNCHCGPNCKCPHPCPGNCYLNRRMKKQRGGSGCGSCGCPIAPLSTKQMNQFGGNMGSYPEVLKQPVMPDIKGGYQGIVGVTQNGGTCGACGQISVVPSNMSGGGNFFKPIGPIPGPIVGNNWSINNLPGQKGISGDANYFEPYYLNNDPTRQMQWQDAGYLTKNSMVGGYRYDKKSDSSSKRGGGLIPQDLVNLGRDFGYNFKTAYNALNGYNAPVDPAPYKGQLTGALNNNRFLSV